MHILYLPSCSTGCGYAQAFPQFTISRKRLSDASPAGVLRVLPLCPMSIDLVSRIRPVAEQLAEEGALFVLDVEVRGHQGARTIEVFIDGAEGVNVDALASISRRLAAHLEEHDVVKGTYRLNVSSPGADRPLTDRRQFGRNVGRPFDITKDLNGEQQTLSGTLTALEEDALILDVNGATERVPFDRLVEARVKLPW